VSKRLPTKALAEAWEQKIKMNAFEGQWFRRKPKASKTVEEIWKLYEKKAKRDCKSWQSDEGRAKHLVEHLGKKEAASLTEIDIDKYRDARLEETTHRGGPPAPATLDRELELLKRMLNYAARSQEIPHNPIGHVKLLRKPNTRDVVLDQVEFEQLYEAAETPLKPIILVAYTTGMRLQEILGLQWSMVNLKEKQFRLPAENLKEKKHRIVVLSERVKDALDELPRALNGDVFLNPGTGERWSDIRKIWARALTKAGIEKDVHFHDLRRSFITNARRRGIPESVVMQMSGHRTREVFARYNVISEADLEAAVKVMEDGRVAELAAAEAETESKDRVGTVVGQ
jgi:integrase